MFLWYNGLALEKRRSFMIRLFQQHSLRKIIPYESLWNFTTEDGRKFKLAVPSAWESHPELSTYRGIGTYDLTLKLDTGANLLMNFGGVSHFAEVLLDERSVARHYDAHTAFSVLVTSLAEGEHVLKVVADNRFTEESTLHIPNDYYSYGGITRPVSFEIVPDVYINRVDFEPFFDGDWHARITVSIHNISKASREVDVSVTLAEKTVTAHVSAELGETVLKFDEKYAVLPWSPESPTLYTASAVLSDNGAPIDDMIDRVGFRTFEARGKELLLNGEPIRIFGFNRHEDHANVGSALPLPLMLRDVQLMKGLGANAVRFSHYPNDERFIDLCDELGLLVWEEHHARGLKLPMMQRDGFDEQITASTTEMVLQHRNHPSIVIWGVFNECASDTEAGRKMYEKQYGVIKALDRSRPTTSASDKHYTDICLDLPDIVSFNIYSEWYHATNTAEAFAHELEWIREKAPDKPLILSEFGAGAIYGYRNPTRVMWSEECQCDILDSCLNTYLGSDDVAGVFIWQFADCRVTEEKWAISRPRTYNNKGVFDEFRRPKLAAEVVKKHFKKESDKK